MIKEYFDIVESQPIPTRRVLAVKNPPKVWRYFAKPKEGVDRPDFREMGEKDYVVAVVMMVNARVPGAFIFSSGKNMGTFKGVGFPEEMADFFRLDEYKGYIWTGHNRFPTNTPGWVGRGAPLQPSWTGPSCTTAKSPPTASTAAGCARTITNAP